MTSKQGTFRKMLYYITQNFNQKVNKNLQLMRHNIKGNETKKAQEYQYIYKW